MRGVAWLFRFKRQHLDGLHENNHSDWSDEEKYRYSDNRPADDKTSVNTRKRCAGCRCADSA